MPGIVLDTEQVAKRCSPDVRDPAADVRWPAKSASLPPEHLAPEDVLCSKTLTRTVDMFL